MKPDYWITGVDPKRLGSIAATDSGPLHVIDSFPPDRPVVSKNNAKNRRKRRKRERAGRMQSDRKKAILMAIHAHQDGLCFYCKQVAVIYQGQGYQLDRATLDHFLPIAMGGTNDISNLVVACFACNNAKADGLPFVPVNWEWPELMEDTS